MPEKLLKNLQRISDQSVIYLATAVEMSPCYAKLDQSLQHEAEHVDSERVPQDVRGDVDTDLFFKAGSCKGCGER
ncbi:hypothetical protein AX777_13900 [Sphingobium yanoikuyae]|uniref:Uncharacterized protein n=1 Tax=Sphingobium yanoikuyae TaxID=13690 RepID=A0A177JUL3_SPHYA|nr:hypothetical protein AX777_13900 [Sphingobium yanoikuyae]